MLEVLELARDVLGGKTACQLGPCLGGERRIGASIAAAAPAANGRAHRSAIETRHRKPGQLTRRARIGVAVHAQTDVVGILIVQAFERQARETRGRRGVHRRPGCCSCGRSGCRRGDAHRAG